MSEAKLNLSDILFTSSKHSHYQEIHPVVASKLAIPKEYQPRKLLEKERESFLNKHVNFNERIVCDIGANTGYFSIAALESGAAKVDAYEGNSQHADFIRKCSSLLGLTEKLCVEDRYVEFDPYDIPHYDVTICFNVLHHIGDDFRNEVQAVEATQAMGRALRNIVINSKTVIFQMGYNWKGNPSLPLTQSGTKQDIIDIVHESLAGIEVDIITGCFTPESGSYEIAHGANLMRRNELGEFRNRPLFVITHK